MCKYLRPYSDLGRYFATRPLRSIESVANILRILHNTTHNGFPVWAHEADEESAYGEVAAAGGQDVSKRLEGIILRSQLLVLLQRRHFVDSLGNPVSCHRAVRGRAVQLMDDVEAMGPPGA